MLDFSRRLHDALVEVRTKGPISKDLDYVLKNHTDGGFKDSRVSFIH